MAKVKFKAACRRVSDAPSNLNGILSLKIQNFAVKSISEKRFTFVQKNSECAAKKQKKIDKRGKNLSFLAG